MKTSCPLFLFIAICLLSAACKKDSCKNCVLEIDLPQEALPDGGANGFSTVELGEFCDEEIEEVVNDPKYNEPYKTVICQ